MTCQIVGCDGKRQQTFVSRHVFGGYPVEVCDHHYVALQRIGPNSETALEVASDVEDSGSDDAGREELEADTAEDEASV